MSDQLCNDVLQEGIVLDWCSILQYLSGDYYEFLRTTSTSSLSVDYERPPWASPNDLQQLSTSIDRAADLVAAMPENARKMLLAPIKHGLLDLQSVFYLKDVVTNERIPISVEDFLRLVSCYFLNSVDEEDFSNTTYELDMALTDPDIPGRLLSALISILEGGYASADNDSGIYSICVSNSDKSLSSQPSLPRTRPPTISSSCSPTLSSIRSPTISSSMSFSVPSVHAVAKCNLKYAIIFGIIIAVIFAIIISAIFIFVIQTQNNDNDINHNNTNTNNNNTISLKFLQKSDFFPILNFVRVAFDYANNQVIVTSVNAVKQSIVEGFTWNGSANSTFHLTVPGAFIHCGVFSVFKAEFAYCCCHTTLQHCSGPDSSGVFRNRTLAMEYVITKMFDFLFIDQQPTFAYMEQYHEELLNETYFTLIFHPNDVRSLNHDEVYDFGAVSGKWHLFAAPQIRRTTDHSVDLLLEIEEGFPNGSKYYAICNYQLGIKNGTMHRNNCKELKNLATYIINSDTNAANFRTITRNGTLFWMVALYREAPSAAHQRIKHSSPIGGKTTVGQLNLIVYDLDGVVKDSTTYEFKSGEYNVEYEQVDGPLITNDHMFVYMQNKFGALNGYLLQYEFEFFLMNSTVSMEYNES